MARGMSGSESHYLRILRKRAFIAQDGLCYWCEKPMSDETADVSDPMRVTAEHLLPLHNGGRTAPGNITAACGKCNSERHPELNSLGNGIVASFGVNEAPSPFECLAALKPAS